MALGANDAAHLAVQHGDNLLRHEGATRPVDETRHAVFFGLWHVIGEAVELLGPHRVLVRLLKIEEPGVEDRVCRRVGVVGLDDPSIGVQAADDLSRCVHLMRLCVGDLVEDHHVREFDLVGQQMNKRPFVLFAQRLAPVRARSRGWNSP